METTDKNSYIVKNERDSRLTEEVNTDINGDETNDFDLSLEKKPALSTMQSNLRMIDKRLAKPIGTGIIPQFDKLKIAINLKKHREDIDFTLKSLGTVMIECVKPEKPDTKYDEWIREKSDLKKVSENGNEKNITESLDKDDPLMFDDFDDVIVMNGIVVNKSKDDDIVEDAENIEITEEETKDTESSSNSENIYSDCHIAFKYRKRGLINVYIKNDVLVIVITGKFTSQNNELSYITKDNIKGALREICQRADIDFNIEEFIKLAHVYLCDICIDILIDNPPRMIDALSSLLPLSSNTQRIMKFGRHGLKIKSKAKNTGSSLTFYIKGTEIRHRLEKVLELHNLEHPDEPITMEWLMSRYPENVDNILRIELQIYNLRDLRLLLDIEPNTRGIVKLTDVLNGKAQPILKRLEKFKITERVLRDKIYTYIENETRAKTDNRTGMKVREWLAGIGMAYLVALNNFDITKVKSHIIAELDTDAENIINSLTTEIKHDYWNFLLYKKPKAIKRVIDLLDAVHTYYGRGADNE